MKFDVISFYDVIYLTERQWSIRAFKLLKQNRFLFKNISSYIHAFPMEPPHHGSKRKQTVEKRSNVLLGITFPESVKIENIIPRNMIINLGCASVDDHIPRDDIFEYHPLRECNIIC